MKKPAALIVLGILVGLLAVPDWRRWMVARIQLEPFSRGRPVSYWIDALADSATRREATEAIQEINGQAAPYLVRALARPKSPPTSPSWLDGLFGARDSNQPNEDVLKLLLLGAGREAIPGIVECLHNGDERTRLVAAELLGDMFMVASFGFAANDGAAALAKACSDPAKPVRLQAIQSLGNAGHFQGRGLSAAVAVLEQASRDPDGEIRLAALAALARCGPPARAAVPSLIEQLADADPEVRGRAATALGAIGEDAAPAVPALCRLVNQDDSAALAAAEALGRIGAVHPQVVPTLIAALRLGHEHEVADAFRRLGPAGKEAVPDLVQALDGGKGPAMVFLALGAMGKEGSQAVPALEALLAHNDPHVRVNSAQALWKIEGRAEKVVAVVVEALPKLQFWSTALELLREIGPEARAAVPFLIQGLHSQDPSQRAHSASVLAAVGPNAAEAGTPLLAMVMNPAEYSLRQEAAITLGALGPEGAFAVPALEAILADPAESIDLRWRAANARWRIGGDAAAAVPVLIEALKSRRADTRKVVMALGELGPAARPAVPALLDRLLEDFVILQLEVARVLWSITGDAEPLLPTLIRITREANALWAVRAMELIADMGPAAREAIPVLVDVQQDDDARIRRSAAQALSRIRPDAH